MPFCPKCWKEYPKGFATCEACEIPLTDVPPDHSQHKHEEEPEEKKDKKAPKK